MTLKVSSKHKIKYPKLKRTEASNKIFDEKILIIPLAHLLYHWRHNHLQQALPLSLQGHLPPHLRLLTHSEIKNVSDLM